MAVGNSLRIQRKKTRVQLCRNFQSIMGVGRKSMPGNTRQFGDLPILQGEALYNWDRQLLLAQRVLYSYNRPRNNVNSGGAHFKILINKISSTTI